MGRELVIVGNFFRIGLGAAFALLIAATHARAEVTLPNGVVVPLDTSNGETQLFTFFSNQGQGLDWRTDAHASPNRPHPVWWTPNNAR